MDIIYILSRGFNMRIDKKIMRSSMVGILVVTILGFLFHELYDLSNNNIIVGLISPINESKWEHWKIVFWPIVIFSIIEYIFLKDVSSNFWFSKAMAIIVAQIITFGAIEAYEMIFGEGGMGLHLISYLCGICLGQITSMLIMAKTAPIKPLKFIGVSILILEIIFLVIFTFKPLKTDYFRNSVDGTYGIYKTTE